MNNSFLLPQPSSIRPIGLKPKILNRNTKLGPETRLSLAIRWAPHALKNNDEDRRVGIRSFLYSSHVTRIQKGQWVDKDERPVDVTSDVAPGKESQTQNAVMKSEQEKSQEEIANYHAMMDQKYKNASLEKLDSVLIEIQRAENVLRGNEAIQFPFEMFIDPEEILESIWNFWEFVKRTCGYQGFAKSEQEKSQEEIAEQKRRELFVFAYRRWYKYCKRCESYEYLLNMPRFGYNERITMRMFDQKYKNASLEELESVLIKIRHAESVFYLKESFRFPFVIVIDPEEIVDSFWTFWEFAKRTFGYIKDAICGQSLSNA
ncbi:unnamed protein product [Caenorhabditis nigoni]